MIDLINKMTYLTDEERTELRFYVITMGIENKDTVIELAEKIVRGEKWK